MKNSEIIKRGVLATSIVLAICVLWLGPGPAWGETKVLKFSHQWTKGDIRDKWASNFISLVEKRTNGSLKFELFPGGVLFKAKAQIDAIRKGALDMCIWPLGYSSGRNKQLSLPELPGLIVNPEDGARFARSEAGQRLAAVAAEKVGFKILAWGWLPTSLGGKKKQILVPSDTKGMKLRGAVKAVEMTMQSAGASITKMPSSEVYMALQTGTLDGLMTTTASFYSFRLHDLVKYLTIGKKYNLIMGLFNIIISPSTFKNLTPEQQKIVTETAIETEKTFRAEVDQVTANAEKAFKDAGATVVPMSKDQYMLWTAEAKKSAWKWYREKVPGGAELLDLALKEK